MAKEVPDREGCQRVARCITAYLHKHPEHYAGIHCSYGFNRTGLVCCACTYTSCLRLFLDEDVTPTTTNYTPTPTDHSPTQTDLCEELGFSVDQALAAFAAARPPGVKHQHFIDALRARYGSPPTADVEISPATTLASACSSGGSPAAVRAAGGKGDDDDGGSAAPAPTVAAAATPAVAAAEGIIPPPRNNETLVSALCVRTCFGLICG